ncbi:hypothetical protein [Paenibacillus sp. GYB003]|uniref:hypothetical protein n=1 Tax=Paenibacillus sp. GYB003 TaxID=2994392 RepID=UPI002F9655D5
MKWKVSFGIVLVVILIVANWLYQNRSEAVYERITNQDGYTLSLVKEGVAAEFFLKPEWIPNRDGEEKRLNLVIEEKFDTKIVLEKVAKREKDFYIQLNTIPHPNRASGQLLSTSLIAGGSFTSTGSFTKWQVTDAAGRDLLGGSFGTGDGPGNVSSLFINDADRGKFEQGANVRFSGYYLYGYRQLPGEYAAYWLPILFTAMLVVVPAVLYRKRSEPENGLAWKLIGYLLLGGFTLSLNDTRLPLGFAVYWLLFRKAKPNRGIKHKAALLGLLLYVSQLMMPGIAGVLESRPRDTVIRNVSMEQLGLDGVWKMVAARVAVSSQARLLSYETVVASDVGVKELSFHLVDRDDRGRYIHTEASYDVSGQSVALKRSWTDEWLQFPRQIMAKHFFERAQSLHLMDLKPSGGDHRLVKLELLEDGTQVNYGMKDAHTLGVDEQGVFKIREEQLPVQAYVMIACGVPQSVHPVYGCEDPAYYLFDIAGTTLRLS